MTQVPHVTISLHDEVPDEEAALIDQGLGESNGAAAPLNEVRRLACFARSPAGELIGGAVGRSWGECCELQQLWVAPQHRKQGIGAQLVRAFEGIGGARGCRTFYLETFSFQAPSLYRALGYTTACELRGFGHGIAKYVMVKESP